jgi:hypothetical protein
LDREADPFTSMQYRSKEYVELDFHSPLRLHGVEITHRHKFVLLQAVAEADVFSGFLLSDFTKSVCRGGLFQVNTRTRAGGIVTEQITKIKLFSTN